MTPEFLSSFVDTIFPGDDSLPTGTAAGVTAKLWDNGELHQPVLQAVAERAGGEESFVGASESERVVAVKAVEKEMKSTFGSLLSLLLMDYYESQPVLMAMGWRAEPPQQRGHPLPPFEEALLEQAKKRGRIWRE